MTKITAMNKLFPALLAVAIALSTQSCNSEKEPDRDPSLGTPVFKDTSSAVVATPGAATVPVTTGDTMPMAQPVASTATTTTAPGMNPAHGQPGHRCDIAVGAPLNSPPGKTTPATTNTTQTVTPTATSTTTKTAPGMNPAHGQPGHRCDIAVGAPLNSPAAKTTTTTTPAATVTPATKPEEVKKETDPANNNITVPATADPVKKGN